MAFNCCSSISHPNALFLSAPASLLVRRLRLSSFPPTSTSTSISIARARNSCPLFLQLRASSPTEEQNTKTAEIGNESSAVSSVREESEEEAKKTISTYSDPVLSPRLSSIYETCKKWTWRTFKVAYSVQGVGPPLLLVHGFGASMGHWRRNIGILSKSNTVYAIDLLGLGASEKPPNFQYTMETWAEMLSDFVQQVIGKPTILIGNSIGSLACTIVAAEAPQGLVQGLVLLNCSGGMNNKAIVDDWRIRLLFPLLWLIDFLLLQKWIASALFQRIQTRENLKNVLQSVYCNKEAVDDELIDIIARPAQDEGALDAFVSVITGPPGPSPIQLLSKISIPVLVLWGDKDPFTPIDGPIGRFFSDLPNTQGNVQLKMLADVGHCPHDDRPELVHNELLPWLATTCNGLT